jgi:hypothetical protein
MSAISWNRSFLASLEAKKLLFPTLFANNYQFQM